ncbi:SMP-30/gluconolactonase/LRE family protein [Microbulbifer sp. YPW1]|uniref:SMP-30/gluconolactonase/LRE family protein n=1 Tax=Microbulbifer sp. YPW1 TaxID=2745199 RepID=UPI00159B4478|nr:SMP-30/gluconolactonase/LRE family protein [Microbulbifer sp. YPW1]QKX17568.1 SMP-30/gluconolactonase/LRE family protein [Microbulbifer sp. YPW1]
MLSNRAYSMQGVIFALLGISMNALSANTHQVEIFDTRALDVLAQNAEVELLAEGFEWTEGPVWVEANPAAGGFDKGSLLFSDIPTHRVLRYVPGEGVSVYLEDSGFSNGLVLSQGKQLLLMQSRSRQVARMDAPLALPQRQFKVLASKYEHGRLNSPNDGVLHNSGILFFTDPPYGLPKQLEDPEKDLDFQGIYALHPDGHLLLIDREVRYPNGIALSPEQHTLYVAASDPEAPAWYAYDVDEEGRVGQRRVFYRIDVDRKLEHGLPDGLKAHSSGMLFATGPGGVWLFDPSGKVLAKVHTPSIAANLAFNSDESAVYFTAHKTLLRLNLRKQ